MQCTSLRRLAISIFANTDHLSDAPGTDANCLDSHYLRDFTCFIPSPVYSLVIRLRLRHPPTYIPCLNAVRNIQWDIISEHINTSVRRIRVEFTAEDNTSLRFAWPDPVARTILRAWPESTHLLTGDGESPQQTTYDRH